MLHVRGDKDIVPPVSYASPIIGQLLRERVIDQTCLARDHAYITPHTHTEGEKTEKWTATGTHCTQDGVTVMLE